MTRTIIVLGLVALMLVAAAAAFAGPMRYSTYGGGKQIWIDTSSFAARGGTTDTGGPAWTTDPAAAATALSGSAYNFPGPPAAPPADQRDWWAEYKIPLSQLPAGFIPAGSTWGFWGRVTSAAAAGTSVDSDFVIANGDPGDINKLNPSDAEWLAAINPAYTVDGQPYQRVFNNSQLEGDLLFGYKWGWWSEGFGTGNVVRTRVFNAVDGANIVFRIYEREAAPENDLADVLVWASDVNYKPSDNDYLGAKTVPEPTSLMALAFGGLMLIRRRRK